MEAVSAPLFIGIPESWQHPCLPDGSAIFDRDQGLGLSWMREAVDKKTRTECAGHVASNTVLRVESPRLPVE